MLRCFRLPSFEQHFPQRISSVMNRAVLLATVAFQVGDLQLQPRLRISANCSATAAKTLALSQIRFRRGVVGFLLSGLRGVRCARVRSAVTTVRRHD